MAQKNSSASVLSQNRAAGITASDDSTRTYTRRELPHSSFEREFALNARVQLDAISASYSEGVLTVRLPKTPDAMRPEQQVPVQ